tara:strand:+ start:2861 stop:4552 length:1692 start_codon:yes stop_codon:yes gene_type:complete
MAKIKISEVGIVPRTPNTPNVEGATLPLGIATQFGKAVGSLGKVIEDIALENKAEEDANEASDVITSVNQKITEAKAKYNRSTKTEDVFKFGNDLDNLEFEASNKNVEKLVNKYIRSKKNSLGLSLGNEIITRSVQKSEFKKNNDLDNYIIMATSNNAVDRITGNRNYQNFWKSADNLKFYGETKLAELKKEKDQLLLKNIYIKKIDNNDLDLTDPKVIEQINKDFGEVGAKGILQKARTKTISDVLINDQQQLSEEKKTVETQLNNFATIINNINTSKIDKDAQTPSLDQVYDLYQIGSLNTAQYNAILEFYNNEDKVSDPEMINLINAQIISASTVKDLDDIQSALNGDKGILDKVSPENVVEFNTIIEKYRRDSGKFNDYKLYSEKLKVDVKDVGGLFSTGGNAAESKDKAINALQEYNRFINQDYSPQDAYLKVISGFTDKDLPKPEKLPMPATLNLTDMKQIINKNPDTAQEAFETKLTEGYKNGTINIEEYKEGIKRLDFIFDVLSVRKSIFGDEVNKKGELKYLSEFGKTKKVVDKEEPSGNFFKEKFNDIKESLF